MDNFSITLPRNGRLDIWSVVPEHKIPNLPSEVYLGYLKFQTVNFDPSNIKIMYHCL